MLAGVLHQNGPTWEVNDLDNPEPNLSNCEAILKPNGPL